MNLKHLLDCLIARPKLRNVQTGKVYQFTGYDERTREVHLSRGAENKVKRTGTLDDYEVVEWNGKPIDPPRSLRNPKKEKVK